MMNSGGQGVNGLSLVEWSWQSPCAFMKLFGWGILLLCPDEKPSCLDAIVGVGTVSDKFHWHGQSSYAPVR